jgi:heme/copper-type cytochrome/quinol oxidase subunit 3
MSDSAHLLAPAQRIEGNARLGMAIFLGTWVMLFAALFLAYAVLRAQAGGWPPAGLPRLPRALPGLATALLLASSGALRWGVARARAQLGVRASLRTFRGAVLLAIGLGVAFGAVQAVVWREVYGAGLVPSSGTYASVFFALTIFHALHVACGLLMLMVVGARNSAAGNGVWLAAVFWDFVTVVWLLIYLTVFWL